MSPQNLENVLQLIREAQQSPLNDRFEKSTSAGITTGLGLVNIDLQKPALALYPAGKMMYPLRIRIPRRKGNGGTATTWRAITGVNTTRMPIGVSEGNRSGVISQSLQNFTMPYVGIGLENNATFEAEYAAEGFDDADAEAVKGVLLATMLGEEQMLIGGNPTVNLGVTPQPVAAGSAVGGALPDGTYYVGCLALTYQGWNNLQDQLVAGPVVQQFARTNADGSTDTINGGTATPSALSAGVVLNAGTAVQSVHAHVAQVPGAIAYAWFLGNAVGHQYIQQITTINSVNFTTALVTAARQDFAGLTAADFSANTVNGTQYDFLGILYQGPFGANTGSYLATLNTGTDGVGTTLTSDGAGGIVEISTAFRAFYDKYRVWPEEIYCNSQESETITDLVVANSGAPLLRLTALAESSNAGIVGGVRVSSLLNKVSGQDVPLTVHPFMPPGTIMFFSAQLPPTYAASGVGNVAEVQYRRDMYQTVWPLRSRKREFGVYADELLALKFLPAFGAITNIAKK